MGRERERERERTCTQERRKIDDRFSNAVSLEGLEAMKSLCQWTHAALRFQFPNILH